MTKVAKEMTAEVSAGKYKSADEAGKAMNAKLEAEKAAYQKNEAIVGKARPLIEKAKGSVEIEGLAGPRPR